MELVVAIAILSILLLGVMMTMMSGQETWSTADGLIQIQENIRIILEKISREMRETGSDSVGASQITIEDNSGVNNSDIIRFSIPIVCQSGGSIMDANGDVAHWGAPLIWGCDDSTCMDADDDCGTADYKYVEYSINVSNQLLRKVLDDGYVTVKEEIFAQNITNLQAVLSLDQNLVTITITMLKDSTRGRQLVSISSMNINLRNR